MAPTKTGPGRPRSIAERFWEKVQKGGGCWEWKAATGRGGYGRINAGGNRIDRAHRISWVLTFGPIPPGMLVCHHCDNARCVRPDHLFLGDSAANNADMRAKGRAACIPRRGGEQHHNSAITKMIAAAIRHRHRAGVTNKLALAREFGVGRMVIRGVLEHGTYRDATA